MSSFVYNIIAIMHKVKGMSDRYLRKEFSELMKLPSMWTRSYFVSTAGQVSLETIKQYIEAQAKVHSAPLTRFSTHG